MADIDAFIADLEEGRTRTLALVADLPDGDVERTQTPILSPLIWDLGHIAAYEDLWLVHRYGGETLLHPERSTIYDAFETPRAVRDGLPLISRAETLRYLDEVRERTITVLKRRGIDGATGSATLPELVLRHEQQHNETMLQAIEFGRLGSAPRLEPGDSLPGKLEQTSEFDRVEVVAGPCVIGASNGAFAYDNEYPSQRVSLPAFDIGANPVTNAAYLDFMRASGYGRREWWSPAGWDFIKQHAIHHPGNWRQGADGWEQWRIGGGWSPLPLDHPVVHVSWFEADAFARAHGARLPTEFEWEKAATWDENAQRKRPLPWGDGTQSSAECYANLDQARLGTMPTTAFPAGIAASGALAMLGDVWEWTGSDFAGYPNFRAYPYREYSEVFFGTQYKVLRGGSWATRTRVATPTLRNWDRPQRRQIFAGIRLAWDR